MQNDYGDIINLPHHISKKHKQMDIMNRAAQFAPFAALVGYEDAIEETGRLTTQKIELDENSREILDEKLQMVLGQAECEKKATITYFLPDYRKEGGKYVTITGKVKMLDKNKNVLIMEEGSKISLEDIYDIQY